MSKASANYFDVMRADQIASSNDPQAKIHLAEEWDRMMAEHLSYASPDAMTGRIVSLAFEDGKDHGTECGLEECECPDHEGSPREAGTYITIQLDGDHRLGFWRVVVSRVAEENPDV